MMSQTLILFFLTAISVWATCYRPGGFASDYRYVPCNNGTQSMCCRTNDNNNPDVCLGNGLCEESGVVWRESCTDSSWQSPECLRLCIDGDGFGNDSLITPCSDNSYCCGWMNTTCCQQGQGVFISNGQVVATSPAATHSSTGVSASSETTATTDTSVPSLVLESISFGPITSTPPHSAIPKYTGSGSLLQGYCVTPDYILLDGPTAYWAPVVGCVNDKTDCCPYSVAQPTAIASTATITVISTITVNVGPGGATQSANSGLPAYPVPVSSDQATLAHCPDDYETVSGGCCPSGYRLWNSPLAGEVPCYSSLSSYLVPPPVPATSQIPLSVPITAGGNITSSTLLPSSKPGQKPTSAIINIVFAIQFPVQPAAPSLSIGAEAGIGAGAGIAAIVIVVLSLLLVWRTRKHKKDKAALSAIQATGPDSTRQSQSVMSSVSPNIYSARTELPSNGDNLLIQPAGSFVPQYQGGYFHQQQTQHGPPLQGYYEQQPVHS